MAGAARRGALQLWQFLVTLLDDPTNSGGATGHSIQTKLMTYFSLSWEDYRYTNYEASMAVGKRIL